MQLFTHIYQLKLIPPTGNYKYLTELVMVLNHKIAQWYERNMPLAKLYNDAWNIADNYAVNHLQGDELNYFYNVTD